MTQLLTFLRNFTDSLVSCGRLISCRFGFLRKGPLLHLQSNKAGRTLDGTNDWPFLQQRRPGILGDGFQEISESIATGLDVES